MRVGWAARGVCSGDGEGAAVGTSAAPSFDSPPTLSGRVGLHADDDASRRLGGADRPSAVADSVELDGQTAVDVPAAGGSTIASERGSADGSITQAQRSLARADVPFYSVGDDHHDADAFLSPAPRQQAWCTHVAGGRALGHPNDAPSSFSSLQSHRGGVCEAGAVAWAAPGARVGSQDRRDHRGHDGCPSPAVTESVVAEARQLHLHCAVTSVGHAAEPTGGATAGTEAATALAGAVTYGHAGPSSASDSPPCEVDGTPS